MNKHDINQEVQLPSDYLLENRNTLERINDFNDFDEMCEELDALQHEATQYAFQDGVTVGEVKVLRQFVNGQLDKEFVQDFLDDYDREIEDNTFRIGDSVCTKEMEDCGVITGVNGYKFIVTWGYGSDAECKTELCASDLIKC